jgi:hypothetical protein
MSATSVDVRGFYKKDRVAQDLLETIGRMFLTGYGYAAEAATVAAAEERLEEIPAQFRGFAYEGAAMGFTIRDGLPFGPSDNTGRFLAGRGAEHIYTALVGIGWAMARLPKFRWPKADGLDPLLRWLVLDGYGFHQAFFQTRRYVDQQFRPASFGWIGDAGSTYGPRAIDQGIGRAMWFVAGTDAARVADTIDAFAESRRSDLYSGAGLAATYAGGVDEAELRLLADRAGEHRGAVAQGAAFAAEARLRGGIVVPHTELATEVFCGMTPERAAQVTHDARVDLADGEQPAYENWRQRIAGEFVVLGGKP